MRENAERAQEDREIAERRAQAAAGGGGDDDEQGEDYEDSDDDGPTAKNPWGRDGDALRGGADAFQKRPSKKRFAKTG